MAQRTSRTGTNALHRELTVAAERRTSASPEIVYDLLADLRTHAVWGGERQGKKTRLLTMDAPEGTAAVGTEFETTGADPTGSFADRSVVTHAQRPSVFEFVTEATLRTKRGRQAEWTNVHRYELRPEGDGTVVAYTLRVARISDLPGALRVLNVPVLSTVAMQAATKIARRGLVNLVEMAEQRASAR